jgi:hypothetical protein
MKRHTTDSRKTQRARILNLADPRQLGASDRNSRVANFSVQRPHIRVAKVGLSDPEPAGVAGWEVDHSVSSRRWSDGATESIAAG